MIWKSKQTIKKKFFVCNFWMLKNDKLCWLWMIDIFMVFLSVYVLTWHSFLWLKNRSKHGFHLDIICRCRIKISQILLECSCHYCANWLKLSIVKVQNVTVTMQWLLLENKASMTLYYLPSFGSLQSQNVSKLIQREVQVFQLPIYTNILKNVRIYKLLKQKMYHVAIFNFCLYMFW